MRPSQTFAGSIHLFGPPAEIANAVRRRVRADVDLPISIGVARTKHLAKIASQVAKPDGLVVVDGISSAIRFRRFAKTLNPGRGTRTCASRIKARPIDA
jgi:DNA polymerase IV